MEVYVSYSDKDREFAPKICDVLKSKGISYWVAYENDGAVDDSAEMQISRISHAKVLLVIVSKNSNESKHVINELNCASMCNKPILPVFIDDVEMSSVFEYYISGSNRLNYLQSGDFTDKLVDTIRSMIGSDEDVLKKKNKNDNNTTTYKSLKEDTNLKYKKRGIKVAVSFVAVLILIGLILGVVFNSIIPSVNYNKAVALMNDKKYDEAIIAFEELYGYKDSEEKIIEVMYSKATYLAEQGKDAEAAIVFGGISTYKDSREKSFALWDKVAQRETISAGSYHTVALKTDGTVVATKYTNNDPTFYEYYRGQCDVSGWRNIIAVSAGNSHTVGLKADGTVVAVGDNSNSQCNVSDWTDMVAIFACGDNTFGLKLDGTIAVAGGDDCLYGWTGVISVAHEMFSAVALKANGTVVTWGDYDSLDFSKTWTDIVAICSGALGTVGLKSDGTVVTTGADEKLKEWKDIVEVALGFYHTVGLKSDGTVVAVGENDFGQCDVGGWTDIVAVSAGYFYTVGLKSDGTVVAVGRNFHGGCDVDGWNNIKLPDNVI